MLLFDVVRKTSSAFLSKNVKLQQLLARVGPHDGALLEGVENVNECCVSPLLTSRVSSQFNLAALRASPLTD